ncbi:MAG: hypothetical protein ABR929_11415 [Roseiarcus sp.]
MARFLTTIQAAKIIQSGIETAGRSAPGAASASVAATIVRAAMQATWPQLRPECADRLESRRSRPQAAASATRAPVFARTSALKRCGELTAKPASTWPAAAASMRRRIDSPRGATTARRPKPLGASGAIPLAMTDAGSMSSAIANSPEK